jgi:beta-lactamase class A
MEMMLFKHQNWKIILLSILLIASVFTNITLYGHYTTKYSIKFPHLSPSISWIEKGEFVDVQNQYSIQFQGLKKEMLATINQSDVRGFYGIYFEDLNTGTWIGINEKDSFVSLSLLKLPVMVAILREVEKGNINLDQKVFLAESDLDFRSGTLGTKGAGYIVTVNGLLKYLISESDNTALAALHRSFLNDEKILEACLAMGLPVEGNQLLSMGPKHYSNILRSLYYSAYLRRSSSEKALSLMSDTKYQDQLPAGIPADISISHKVGFMYDENKELLYYHDCGIIYHPKKPYILCIMSKDAHQAEVDRVMSNLSRTVYDYVSNLA